VIDLFVPRNDLYCVGWGVKLYSLSHSLTHLIDWGLASPAQCTLDSNPQTVDRNLWKKLQIGIDVLT